MMSHKTLFHFFVALLVSMGPCFADESNGDLTLDGLSVLLQQHVETAEAKAQRAIKEKEEKKSQAEQKLKKENARITKEIADAKEKDTELVNRLGRPNSESVTPTEHEQSVDNLYKILRQIDDPKAVLQSLVAEGELSLSPNDIYLTRLASALIEKAENEQLVAPETINNMYQIDTEDRYKTYDVYIHDSGTTMIEFLDVTGAPWPIYDISPAAAFNVQRPEDNSMWVTVKERFKNNNIFITLDKFKAPLQFNLIYSSTKRHGMATYVLPFISPTNQNADRSNKSNRVDLQNPQAGQPTAPRDRSGSGSAILTVSTIDQQVLSYLANTGGFEAGSDSEKNAKSVMVSDSKVAKIWFYNDKFLVRTPYVLLEPFENVVNSGGVMKVYVASDLNSIISFQGGGSDHEMLIPDYHQYRSGWK
jgi:flagellar motility protein MotE (MotC chaperone)